MSVTDRFPRPVICTWCGNRHRTVIPDDLAAAGRYVQGDNCAAEVFQATAHNLESLGRSPNRLVTPCMLPEAGGEPLRGLSDVAVGDWLVRGYYGSTSYDCDLLRFARNPPTAPAKPICDNCIGERVTAEDLERIGGHYP
jgi:hypothetical protein